MRPPRRPLLDAATGREPVELGAQIAVLRPTCGHRSLREVDLELGTACANMTRLSFSRALIETRAQACPRHLERSPPAMIASRITRLALPRMSLTTLDNLMLASSRTFSIRTACLANVRDICLRVRVNSRNSWGSLSAGRSSRGFNPSARSSASPRRGSCLTCVQGRP